MMYATEKKRKDEIRSMFNAIAPNYDFLNHLLTLGIDRYWRKKTLKRLSGRKYGLILDLAAGTGDMSVQAAFLQTDKIIGIDISDKMLNIGKAKVKKKNLDHLISLEKGDAENIGFPDEYFDAVMVSFGIRNFNNLDKGLAESYRVLKKGGIFLALEFSRPKMKIFSSLYYFYFRKILPHIGHFFSNDKSAYFYLPASVEKFPEGKGLLKILSIAGFENVNYTPLTFGIVSIYEGQKLEA